MKLKRIAVDLAWKTEGLPRYLEKKGESNQASIIKWAQTIALWDPIVAGIEYAPSEKPSIEKLAKAFYNMEKISRYYNYDSGKRKFNSI